MTLAAGNPIWIPGGHFVSHMPAPGLHQWSTNRMEEAPEARELTTYRNRAVDDSEEQSPVIDRESE